MLHCYSQVCFRTLDLYTSAVIEAVLDPPPAPKPEWRAMISRLAGSSCDEYRQLVGGFPSTLLVLSQQRAGDTLEPTAHLTAALVDYLGSSRDIQCLQCALQV